MFHINSSHPTLLIPSKSPYPYFPDPSHSKTQFYIYPYLIPSYTYLFSFFFSLSPPISSHPFRSPPPPSPISLSLSIFFRTFLFPGKKSTFYSPFPLLSYFSFSLFHLSIPLRCHPKTKLHFQSITYYTLF